ncbi:peptidoglycan-binding protein [Kitasatospora purpeofusca]|uniref:peptidoglycan-binding protein n=1 Tax=Kitasatospora purpeofusca TaxID=67352 RepID=UPI0038194C52
MERSHDPVEPEHSAGGGVSESNDEVISETGADAHVLNRRRRNLVLVVIGALLVSGAGIAASAVIKSPGQAAAEAAPPAPDVLTAQVQKRVLTSTVVARGNVTAEQSVDVAPVGGGTAGGSKQVVTKLPVKVGDSVTEGRLLLEVAGRPVFALQGALPLYRDLKPGALGQDVRQLQEALERIGFGRGTDPAGTFGPGTKQAVTAFYAAAGYDPQPASPDAATQLDSAKDAVSSAKQALDDAKDALAAAERATDAPASPGLPSADPSLTGTPPSQTPGSRPPAGADGAGAARKQVDRAGESLTRAKKKLADLQTVTGPMVPASEIVMVSGFPARVDAVAGRLGAEASGKVLTLSAGSLVVRGSVTASNKGLVHHGQPVEIFSEATGVKVAAKVESISDRAGEPTGADTAAGAAQAGQGAKAAAGYQLTVIPDQALDPKFVGQDVRLTVTAASSEVPVLVVPVSAVSATADGRTVVTVYAEGRRRQVEVTPSTVGGGSVQVTPLVEGALQDGEQVIVGIKDAGAR